MNLLSHEDPLNAVFSQAPPFTGSADVLIRYPHQMCAGGNQSQAFIPDGHGTAISGAGSPLVFRNVLDIMCNGRVKLSMMMVLRGHSKIGIAMLSENQKLHWNKGEGRCEL
jgi:hypothetical protein